MARKNLIVPEGWVAFFNPTTKKVVGITHFPQGGKAFTDLAFAVAASKEDLLLIIQDQELLYTPPAENPTVTPPAP
jgi:hypothetical protein